jgi:hypothetical protein
MMEGSLVAFNAPAIYQGDRLIYLLDGYSPVLMSSSGTSFSLNA